MKFSGHQSSCEVKETVVRKGRYTLNSLSLQCPFEMSIDGDVKSAVWDTLQKEGRQPQPDSLPFPLPSHVQGDDGFAQGTRAKSKDTGTH